MVFHSSQTIIIIFKNIMMFNLQTSENYCDIFTIVIIIFKAKYCDSDSTTIAQA